MTELLGRVRNAEGTEVPPRSLSVSGMVAAAVAVAIPLLVCMAIAVIGWFLADAGAHGTTNDALRIGADAWLMGLGTHVVAAGLPLGVTPLTLTLVIVLAGFRCGRWATRHPAYRALASDGRALALAGLAGAAVYVLATLAVVMLAQRPDDQPGLTRALVGAVVLGGVPVLVGLGAGTGGLRLLVDRVPGYVRSMLRGGLASVALVVAAAAVLVAVALLTSFNQASDLISGLRLGAGDALMMCVVTALFAPNAALLGASVLAGPGFAFGTGTSVTATSTALGPLPAFPLLAALPDPGHAPGAMTALLAVPVVCAAVGAGLAQARYRVTAWDSASLRAFGSGLAGGLLLWVLVAVAGGSLGNGRMADIGAPLGELLVSTIGGMSIGGLLGGLAVTCWQRARARRRGLG